MWDEIAFFPNEFHRSAKKIDIEGEEHSEGVNLSCVEEEHAGLKSGLFLKSKAFQFSQKCGSNLKIFQDYNPGSKV